MRPRYPGDFMKRMFAAAAVLATFATFARHAVAGEITLFSDTDFRGNRVTLQGAARDLSGMGMNDRVSSVVVQSGTWVLCEHRDFGGRCAELGPGEYRALPDFNDAISSVREVGGRGGYRGGDGRGDGYRDGGYRDGGYRDDGRREDGPGWRNGRRGGDGVELFAGPRFEGQRIRVDDDFRTLEQIGFNDRASSIVIREGSWQFCEHADFRGQCVVLGPGEYPVLDRLSNRISSVRRVR
jgi:hypothetical protein